MDARPSLAPWHLLLLKRAHLLACLLAHPEMTCMMLCDDCGLPLELLQLPSNNKQPLVVVAVVVVLLLLPLLLLHQCHCRAKLAAFCPDFPLPIGGSAPD